MVPGPPPPPPGSSPFHGATIPDVICFQEHKLRKGELEREMALAEGWDSYFAFTRGKTGCVVFVRPAMGKARAA